jgi:hypothetical protein
LMGFSKDGPVGVGLDPVLPPVLHADRGMVAARSAIRTSGRRLTWDRRR